MDSIRVRSIVIRTIHMDQTREPRLNSIMSVIEPSKIWRFFSAQRHIEPMFLRKVSFLDRTT